MSRVFTVMALAVLLAASTLGCSTNQTPSPSPARGPEAQIPIDNGASPASVPVNVTTEPLSPERRAAFDK